MQTCQYPEPKAAFSKPFTGQLLTKTFEQIARLPRPFTGFLKITADNGNSFYLFLLQSEAYAAGRIVGNRPLPTTIGEFFAGVGARPAEPLSLALFETDPILLKSMLVLLQEEVTIKAPANLIPLADILTEIIAGKEDALVVVENEGLGNFFFIKQGIAAPPHLVDPTLAPPKELTGREMILHAVAATSASPPVVYLFRHTTTGPATDAAQFDRQQLLVMSAAIENTRC